MNTSDWITLPENTIRYRINEYLDFNVGFMVKQYEFEVFKRPYLFGLIGNTRWVKSIKVHFFDFGYEYSKKKVSNDNRKE